MKARLLSLFLLGVSCSQSEDESPAGTPPDALEVREGHGYMGSDSIVWENGRLSFTTRGPYGEEDRREVTPSAEEWRAFWANVDSLDIWGWEELYSPEVSVMDGTRWSVAIAHQGRQMKSDGYNAFPKDYQDLWQALRDLEGKPPSPTPP